MNASLAQIRSHPRLGPKSIKWSIARYGTPPATSRECVVYLWGGLLRSMKMRGAVTGGSSPGTVKRTGVPDDNAAGHQDPDPDARDHARPRGPHRVGRDARPHRARDRPRPVRYSAGSIGLL